MAEENSSDSSVFHVLDGPFAFGTNGLKNYSELTLSSELEMETEVFHPAPGIDRTSQLFLVTALKAGLKGFQSLDVRERERVVDDLATFVDLLRPVPGWKDTFLVYDFKEDERSVKAVLKPDKFDCRKPSERQGERVEVSLIKPFNDSDVLSSRFERADPSLILQKLQRVEAEREKVVQDRRFPEIQFAFYNRDNKGVTLRARLTPGGIVRVGFDGYEEQAQEPPAFKEIALDRSFSQHQPVKNLFQMCGGEFAGWEQVFWHAFNDLSSGLKEASQTVSENRRRLKEKRLAKTEKLVVDTRPYKVGS